MMKRLVVYTLLVSVLCAGLFAPSAYAAKCPDQSILGFPAWFQGLECEKDTVQITDMNQIWIIVMNVVQWLIIAGGYVALYFIVWSGFKYITAAGDPQKITSAKNALTNAIIGLIIVLASVAIVRTVQASIGGVIT